VNRRTAMSALLLLGAAPSPADALLVGDSLAFQLASRLFKAMRPRVLAADGRGGSSTRQWLRDRLFRQAVLSRPARVVLVSLGVNCTRAERPGLAADIKKLVTSSPVPVVWLLPPPLKFDTGYLHNAVAEAGCRSFDPGALPLDDGVHPTDAGHKRWAELLVEHLWPRVAS